MDLSQDIEFPACECGHTEPFHHTEYPNSITMEEVTWCMVCPCQGFEQMDWVTDFCDIPRSIS